MRRQRTRDFAFAATKFIEFVFAVGVRFSRAFIAVTFTHGDDVSAFLTVHWNTKLQLYFERLSNATPH